MLYGTLKNIVSMIVRFLVPAKWEHKKLQLKYLGCNKVISNDEFKWISVKFDFKNKDSQVNFLTASEFFVKNVKLERNIYLPQQISGAVRIINLPIGFQSEESKIVIFSCKFPKDYEVEIIKCKFVDNWKRVIKKKVVLIEKIDT
jgi:hypothetical protein